MAPIMGAILEAYNPAKRGKQNGFKARLFLVSVIVRTWNFFYRVFGLFLKLFYINVGLVKPYGAWIEV